MSHTEDIPPGLSLVASLSFLSVRFRSNMFLSLLQSYDHLPNGLGWTVCCMCVSPSASPRRLYRAQMFSLADLHSSLLNVRPRLPSPLPSPLPLPLSSLDSLWAAFSLISIPPSIAFVGERPLLRRWLDRGKSTTAEEEESSRSEEIDEKGERVDSGEAGESGRVEIDVKGGMEKEQRDRSASSTMVRKMGLEGRGEEIRGI